jgi:hypothetical protein
MSIPAGQLEDYVGDRTLTALAFVSRELTHKHIFFSY